MSLATLFDEIYYITNEADVANAVLNEQFSDGLQHFTFFGGKELRSPNAFFDPVYYSSENPLVVQAIEQNQFNNLFQHYQIFGEKENRAPSLDFDGFNADTYLLENPDVLTALNNGSFNSALDHFISFGRLESRHGTGIARVFELTDGIDNLKGTSGNDIFTGTDQHFHSLDRINGGGGTDTLRLIHTGLATVPSVNNLLSIEQIWISDTVHQSLDFSKLTEITSIELDSGTTVDGSTITLTIGAEQKLTLDSITDGDINSASINDGGIKIQQLESQTLLNLDIDDLGPSSSIVFSPSAIAKESVFIDIAGTGVTSINITNANTSFIAIENSGASLSNINLFGSGTFGLIAGISGTINATSLATALLLTGSSSGNIVTGSPFSDIIVLSGGTNNVVSGGGHDNITLSTGTDTILSGAGNDIIAASSGTNNISTGDGNDEITLTGGINEVNAGTGDDTVTASGGASNVDIRVLEGGDGEDTLRIVSTGNVTLPTFSGFETIFISDTVHQSLDFSLSSSVTEIELGLWFYY